MPTRLLPWLFLLIVTPVVAVEPTAMERLVARAEPALVTVTASIAVSVVWDQDGETPRQYGPWMIERRGEGALVSGDGVVLTASSLVRLGDPALLALLAEERFLLEVAGAWRREAEARGDVVQDESLREGLRRLRRRGKLRVTDPLGSPRVVVGWGGRQWPATVANAGGPREGVARLQLDGKLPWPHLVRATEPLTAGARVVLLARRDGDAPELLDGVVSRHPEIDFAWATDLAVEVAAAGAPVVDSDGRWTGIVLPRLEGDSPFGVSWVVDQPGAATEPASRLNELWEQALAATWAGDTSDARADLEEILAIREGFEPARRRLEALPVTPAKTSGTLWVLLVAGMILLLVGFGGWWWGRALRKRARREMIQAAGSRRDPKEIWR